MNHKKIILLISFIFLLILIGFVFLLHFLISENNNKLYNHLTGEDSPIYWSGEPNNMFWFDYIHIRWAVSKFPDKNSCTSSTLGDENIMALSKIRTEEQFLLCIFHFARDFDDTEKYKNWLQDSGISFTEIEREIKSSQGSPDDIEIIFSVLSQTDSELKKLAESIYWASRYTGAHYGISAIFSEDKEFKKIALRYKSPLN